MTAIHGVYHVKSQPCDIDRSNEQVTTRFLSLFPLLQTADVDHVFLTSRSATFHNQLKQQGRAH